VVRHELATAEESIERAIQPYRPLPRGRHGLPREAVTKSQRTRIIDSMVSAVAHRGCGETRVVDVVERAGVSRATFYDLFEDLEDCFLATYDHVSGRVLETAMAAFDQSLEAPWPERVRAVTAAVLELYASWPEGARFAVVEVLAAGPNALSRRDASVRQLARLIDTGRDEFGVELPEGMSLAIMGGIQELLLAELNSGEASDLPSHAPEIVYWITLPFLGPEAAAVERDRTRGSLHAYSA
jgi:AcrR family transcriptional regulator